MDIDRAVQALIDDAWEGEWETAVEVSDLQAAVALVTRVIRDDIVIAWQNGEIGQLLDVEKFLNDRIEALGARSSMTGDTTMPGFAGFRG